MEGRRSRRASEFLVARVGAGVHGPQVEVVEEGLARERPDRGVVGIAGPQSDLVDLAVKVTDRSMAGDEALLQLGLGGSCSRELLKM